MREANVRQARWWIVCAGLCTLALAIGGWLCWRNTATTVLLVRHAEKAGPGNADLTPAGTLRAGELVAVAEEAGVVAVYATEWCRTALTAKPLAEALGLTIRVQRHPSGGLAGCTPEVPAELYELLPASITSDADLAAHLLARHRGGVVLVVGHSNTVPALVAELGGGAFAPIPELGNAFDRLFVLTVHRRLAAPRLVKARYGAASCADGGQASCGP